MQKSEGHPPYKHPPILSAFGKHIFRAWRAFVSHSVSPDGQTDRPTARQDSSGI